MKSKQTHTVQDIENWMYEITSQIQNAETKTEKQALLKKLKTLEQHYNSCNEKALNGKKYPMKKEPKDISKEELLALIEEVDVPNNEMNCHLEGCIRSNGKYIEDISGAFPPFTKQ